MGSGASNSKKASGQELERKIEVMALDNGAEIESEGTSASPDRTHTAHTHRYLSSPIHPIARM